MKTAKHAPTANVGEEELSGTVEILHCAKPTFAAGRLRSNGRLVSFSVKGMVRLGYPVTIVGQWETHPKFGRQFKGRQVVQTMPATKPGIVAWLENYATGIGPVKARRAVEAFGVELPRMMKDDPQQVAIELNLPIEFVNRTATLWNECVGQTNALVGLLAHGLTQHEAESLYERYKGAAVTVLETDPYSILGEVAGFGWARVDSLGVKMGIPATDERRTVAAFVESIRQHYDKGSTAVPRSVAIADTSELLGGAVSPYDVTVATDFAVERKRIRKYKDIAFALPKSSQIETRLWFLLRGLKGVNPYFRNVTDDEIAASLALSPGIEPDSSQVDAVRLSLTYRGVVITGSAGSGKTTIARAIYRQYMASDLEVAVVAPTGKAAKRIGEVIGCEASTIHRLLGYNPLTGGFLHGDGNSLPHRAVFVDEVSMCDSSLLESLLAAVGPDTCVVMIGDPNQLPPVGAGFPLRDILAYDLCPVKKLDKCHRQAGPLAASCAAVLQGETRPTDCSADVPGWAMNANMGGVEAVVKAVTFLFAGAGGKPAKLREWGFGGIDKHQFMTAQHKGPLGTKAMNELLQRLHQATLGVTLSVRNTDEVRLPLLVGDKVIQTRNNYLLGVMNGTLGTVVDDKPLVVAFDMGDRVKEVPIPSAEEGEVSLAYCLTPHKMQGSQVPCAVVIVPNQHSFMQHRNWLYTAVTRAQKTAVVVGDPLGVRRAAERVEVSTRRTILELFSAHPEVIG